MLDKRSELPLWLGLCAMAVLALVGPLRRPAGTPAVAASGTADDRPFGKPPSAEEPLDIARRRAREQGRGRRATSPLQIPWQGWKDIFWRVYAEMNSNRLLAIAGGVAFFVLLAIFPAITALVSAFGLFFSASTFTHNFSLLADVMPGNVVSIVSEQADRIASNSSGTLSTGIVVGILVSVWSAMSGVKAMLDALNVIYGQQESRSFIKLNVVALVFTLGGFAAFLLAIAAVIVLPLVLSYVGLGGATAALTRVVRWPALFLVLLVGFSVLYRYGPDRRTARWQWVSVGGAFAATMWIAASFLFSWYLSSFANYNATYGSLGAVVGLMMWLWIATIDVLLGAELNAEIEHQTARDSTVGGDKPLGARGAVMADNVGAPLN
jgi:membrane protein